MEEIEKLGRKLAAAQDRNKDLYVRTREAEQYSERLFAFLKKLKCPNRYCENGELFQWKWNGKTTRTRYKIGDCNMCGGTGIASDAFLLKEKRAKSK